MFCTFSILYSWTNTDQDRLIFTFNLQYLHDISDIFFSSGLFSKAVAKASDREQFIIQPTVAHPQARVVKHGKEEKLN